MFGDVAKMINVLFDNAKHHIIYVAYVPIVNELQKVNVS